MIQGTMLTVGTIKEKYYDNDTLIYKVDLPVFKSPGVQESKLTSTILEATACVSPGTYEPYNIGDQVYIGFINNELNQPVILGKIAKKLNSDEKSSALNKINSLEVVDSAKLPSNITIGNISYADLIKMKSYVNINISNESSKKYIHNISLIYGIDSLRFPLSFVWENNNPEEYTSETIWSSLVNELIDRGYEVPSSVTLPLEPYYNDKTLFESLKMVRCNNAWDSDTSSLVNMNLILGIGARMDIRTGTDEDEPDEYDPFIYLYTTTLSPTSYTTSNRSIRIFRAPYVEDEDFCWVNDNVILKED